MRHDMANMRIWIKTVGGKIAALIGVVVALMTIVDYLLKWQIYPYLATNIGFCLKLLFFQSINTPLYLILILLAVSFFFIITLLWNKIQKHKYYIPIKSKFYTGYEPTDYDRQTRWSYKGNDKYYFVPLLSHGYNVVNFVDLCGPYCKKCNHILHLDGDGELGRKFICVNCVKTYKIPKELLGDYENKLLSYFREEYRQGKLREA